ncbi:hypothetical protein AGMMS50212_12030 [Spirochaetia bacterium]|nr:hypothetical protein AGMMS50212_12030 [Spirochaetia bacterium]
MGQSNLAAGATVGSNHNSRGNDGEIIAGRGFWPGLSSAIKHNSRFASYTLIAKGNYPVELDIPLPFCLLTNNRENSRRVVMPAYWWMYNMFALERNSWKYKSRDDRTVITQRYETDYLAPDTVHEIINALSLLDTWASQTDNYDRVLAPGRTLERSEQAVRVVKVHAGAAAYRQMLCYYAVKTLTNYLKANKTAFNVFQSENKDSVSFEWENLGGQLVPKAKVEALCDAIRNGALKSWKDIHGEYERLYAEYPHDKAHNALQVLRFLNGSYDTPVSNDKWNEFLDEALRIRSYIEDQVYKTKLKDYSDPFRNITYSNDEERDAVLGRLDKNQFVLAAREESRLFAASVQACRM